MKIKLVIDSDIKNDKDNKLTLLADKIATKIYKEFYKVNSVKIYLTGKN
mgnify:CR=1 FL=1